MACSKIQEPQSKIVHPNGFRILLSGSSHVSRRRFGCPDGWITDWSSLDFCSVGGLTSEQLLMDIESHVQQLARKEPVVQNGLRTEVFNAGYPFPTRPWTAREHWFQRIVICIGSNDFKTVSSKTPEQQAIDVAENIRRIKKGFGRFRTRRGKVFVILPPPRCDEGRNRGYPRFLRALDGLLKEAHGQYYKKMPPSLMDQTTFQPQPRVLRYSKKRRNEKRNKSRRGQLVESHESEEVFDIHLSDFGYRKLVEFLSTFVLL